MKSPNKYLGAMRYRTPIIIAFGKQSQEGPHKFQVNRVTESSRPSRNSFEILPPFGGGGPRNLVIYFEVEFLFELGACPNQKTAAKIELGNVFAIIFFFFLGKVLFQRTVLLSFCFVFGTSHVCSRRRGCLSLQKRSLAYRARERSLTLAGRQPANSCFQRGVLAVSFFLS